ncbi:hypothetical protein ATL17_0951 [Maritalea mobilis]|uniref:Uncharacterized protein n=1 Tax=Maritalea mobilis TaxID=483324 RepID=A0A4R6W1W3_9HYPH|nr:hypothetical protein ATL17_0951 [Maritalea mobilis]
MHYVSTQSLLDQPQKGRQAVADVYVPHQLNKNRNVNQRALPKH